MGVGMCMCVGVGVCGSVEVYVGVCMGVGMCMCVGIGGSGSVCRCMWKCVWV